MQMIDTSGVKKGVQGAPMPYMLLKAEETGDADFSMEQDGVILYAETVECAYVDSRPTNTTNLAVSQDFLNRFGSIKPATKSANRPSSADKNSKPEKTNDLAVVGTGLSGKYRKPESINDLKIDDSDPAIQYALE